MEGQCTCQQPDCGRSGDCARGIWLRAHVHDKKQREPRQQRAGLDRVPGPVTSPVQYRVGPQAAEPYADAAENEAGARPVQLSGMDGIG